MRRIAIIGSGIAGLLTAHGLRRAGHEVTLYSDRTGRQWVEESRPTGAAARFDRSLSYDRELGLAFWEGHPATVGGVSLVVCPKGGNQLVTLNGRTARPLRAVDVRRMSERWMAELEQRGGRVVVEPVTVEKLDAISAQHDLTVVAVGRADLCSLFEPDPVRSVYDRPQRNLCMVVARGRPVAPDGMPYNVVRFNVIEPDGEVFWMPFVHMSEEPAWVILFEAKPGSRMDRFGGVKSGDEAIAMTKQVVRELMPWDVPWAEALELADPHGWLVGAIKPTVRNPVGRLPSGRVVTGVGDTLIALDPVGGQGANNGTRMARHLVEAVGARGDAPFDAAWMTETFESFYRSEGDQTVRFNNLLLEPMTSAGKLLLVSQYGSDGVAATAAQRLANAFADNFDDPRTFTHALQSTVGARRAVASTGGNWVGSLVRGAAGVARGQLRQALGRPPRHPGFSP